MLEVGPNVHPTPDANADDSEADSLALHRLIPFMMANTLSTIRRVFEMSSSTRLTTQEGVAASLP
jgi:hypothetical protein